MSVQDAYAEVVKDLKSRRESRRMDIEGFDLLMQETFKKKRLAESEVKSIADLIAQIEPYLDPSNALQSEDSIGASHGGDYRAMSMRWACLKCLGAMPHRTMTTAQIATEIQAGGYPPSTNLNSKLSAILGQMVNKDELERESDCWKISESGKQRWNGISTSEKYLRRFELHEVEDDSSQVEDHTALHQGSYARSTSIKIAAEQAPDLLSLVAMQDSQ